MACTTPGCALHDGSFIAGISGAPVLPQAQTPTPPTTPQGTVLYQSHGEPPAPADEPVDPNRTPLPAPVQQPETRANPPAGPELTDRERSALLFTAYDLDARMTPPSHGLTVRARMTVRNRGTEPLSRISLQISSSLNWDTISITGPEGPRKLPLVQHLLDTDTDHTGQAREAVLELPSPLAPGASLTLDTFYSGTVSASAGRLTRIGASDTAGLAADWDRIATHSVALRGFGNVLWYPVSAPQLFLGEGTRMFNAIDQSKVDEEEASVRLRLSVEYTGDAPTAVYFCGRRAAFAAFSDTPDAPTASSTGIATVDFPAEPLGFRTPSLFVVEQPEVLTGRLAGELAGGESMLAVASPDPSAAPALAGAAEAVAPLLQSWIAARPLTALTVLAAPEDSQETLAGLSGPHPLAVPQPFEDGPLLVAPIAALTTSDAAPALTFSLTHAWVQSGRPWIDEGLAEFFALLTIEQAHGRDAMIAALQDLLKPLTQPEADTGSAPTPQALTTAASELYYRRKAAAVWLMLREIVGDQALQITLQAMHERERTHGSGDDTAEALESLLEQNSGKDLHVFFADWVLAGRGLPDLTLQDVSARALPPSSTGRSTGFLTVVTVRNAGEAMANVPLTVSSGSFSTTVRMQVPGATGSDPGTATARVQTESAPTAVQVNDGVTPEVHSSVHRRELRSR